MTSTKTLQLSACASQSVATPVARHDVHALRSRLALSPPQLWPGLESAAGRDPAAPTTSCGRTAAAEPDLGCPELLDSPRATVDSTSAHTEAQPAPTVQPFPPSVSTYVFGSSRNATPAVFGDSPRLAAAVKHWKTAVAGSQKAPQASAQQDTHIPPPSHLMPLTLHNLRDMKPCSVQIKGSVLLRGDCVTPVLNRTTLPRPQDPSAAFATPRKSPPAGQTTRGAPGAHVRGSSGGSSTHEADPCRREPSFADLLEVQAALQALATPRRAGKRRDCAAPPCGRLLTPQHSLALPPWLGAEMVTTPRKRARKSAAPARAPPADGDLVMQSAACAAALLECGAPPSLTLKRGRSPA